MIHNSDSNKCFLKLISFLIDNTFAIFGGHVFKQCRNFYQLYTYSHRLVLLSIERRFHVKCFLKKNENKLSRFFNFTSRYIDDVFY